MKPTIKNKIASYKLKETDKKELKFNCRNLRVSESDKVTALCIANSKIKKELELLLKSLSYFNANKLDSTNDSALINDKTIQSFITNYLKVSKDAYKNDTFKDFKKSLFNYSSIKKQYYLVPAFLFLLGMNKNRTHYLQLFNDISLATSPDEIKKVKNAKDKARQAKIKTSKNTTPKKSTPKKSTPTTTVKKTGAKISNTLLI